MTSIAFRVLLVCAAVFVLCLMFVAHLPRPALSVAMTVAEVVGMGAALVAIVGFFLDPRFRDFMDVDNPTYQRDRSE